MSQAFFMGVDVGSASVRAAIFTPEGNNIATSTQPISQFHMGNVHVEQSSTEIWSQICKAVKETIKQSQIDISHIKAIGFDATCSLMALGHSEQTLSISEKQQTDHDIIMWMDHRAIDEAKLINNTNDEALTYVGGEVSVEMQLPKILWIKKYLPNIYQQVWRFFDLADFLVWKATQNDVASQCTLTCKWNYLSHKKQFSHSLLSAIELTDLLNKIPSLILEPGQKAGYLCAKAAEQLGLSQSTIVATGTIDAHAGAAILTGQYPQNTLAIISGTSNCLMKQNPTPIMISGVWGPYYGAVLPNFWLTEGGQSSAGALIEWTLQQHSFYPQLLEQAKQAQCHYIDTLNQWVIELEKDEFYPTKNLHLLPNHHGNRSPYANPNATGLISGLTLEQGKKSLARLYLATIQALVYGIKEIIEHMKQVGHDITVLRLCGGATYNAIWLREYANILQQEIQLTQEHEIMALGSAVYAAVACHYYPDINTAATKMLKLAPSILPDPKMASFHQAKYRVFLTLYPLQQQIDQIMKKACN